MQALPSEVQMTPQSKAPHVDELELLDAAPKRQMGMVRSNSIVF